MMRVFRVLLGPSARLTPLKQAWPEIYKPIVEHMKLQIRYNTKRKTVDLRVGTLVLRFLQAAYLLLLGEVYGRAFVNDRRGVVTIVCQ